jgi:SAM-dependent methyltransferase
VAYGFMGSQALFAALELGVFTELATAPADSDRLAATLGVPPSPLKALLAACLALGLLERDGEHYRNTPGAGRYLVRGARRYVGDYYLRQVATLLYPQVPLATAVVRGEAMEPTTYFNFLDDPHRAEEFIRGQHNGSAGPAYLLARTLDLTGNCRLGDLGGGSGAFAIELVRHHPGLTAVVLDHPKVIEVARKIVAEAGLADRIECVAGDVLTDPWPARTDVLLLSYVVSSYSQQALRRLLAQTHQHLPAGGRLIIHDFALHADRPGPRNSAQWFFANLSISARTHPHTVLEIVHSLEAAGYGEVTAQPHVPDVTFLFTARKPA